MKAINRLKCKINWEIRQYRDFRTEIPHCQSDHINKVHHIFLKQNRNEYDLADHLHELCHVYLQENKKELSNDIGSPEYFRSIADPSFLVNIRYKTFLNVADWYAEDLQHQLCPESLDQELTQIIKGLLSRADCWNIFPKGTISFCFAQAIRYLNYKTIDRRDDQVNKMVETFLEFSPDKPSLQESEKLFDNLFEIQTGKRFFSEGGKCYFDRGISANDIEEMIVK